MNGKAMPLHLKQLGRLLLWLLAFLITLHLLTGLILNHSKHLDLAERYLTWDWLMSHYDMDLKQADASFLVDDKIISQFDTQLFVDAVPITHLERPLLGAITLDDVIVLATDQALVLLSREGEFLDRLHAEAGIPAPIQNIGTYHGEPVLQARSGMWRSDFLLDEWEPLSLQGVSWSRPYPMPDSVATELKTYFHGKGVSVRQVLTDWHNGSLLAPVGIWLNDLLIIILLLLFFSGLRWWNSKLK